MNDYTGGFQHKYLYGVDRAKKGHDYTAVVVIGNIGGDDNLRTRRRKQIKRAHTRITDAYCRGRNGAYRYWTARLRHLERHEPTAANRRRRWRKLCLRMKAAHFIEKVLEVKLTAAQKAITEAISEAIERRIVRELIQQATADAR